MYGKYFEICMKNGEVHFGYIKRNLKRKRTEQKTVVAEKIFDRVFG